MGLLSHSLGRLLSPSSKRRGTLGHHLAFLDSVLCFNSQLWSPPPVALAGTALVVALASVQAPAVSEGGSAVASAPAAAATWGAAPVCAL